LPLRAIQRGPGGQGVHVVAPMDDFSVFDGDDGDEAVVVRCTARKNFAVHLIFEDHDARVLGAMDLERVA